MEHLQHFGLSRDPFLKDPVPALHFDSDTAMDAERRLLRGCLQRRGLGLLSAGIGLGKSTVVRRLLEQLDDERFDAHLLVLVHGGVDGAWLTHRLASLLGIEAPPRERAQLCGELFDRLAALHEEGRHAVLLIDDAQLLARRESETLTELRGLLGLEHEGQHLLTVVLAGSSELERGIARDPGLAQRVDVGVSLAPLDTEGVSAFLAHRIRVAGGDGALLEPAALDAIARRSAGVPRLALTLADNALHEAWLLGASRVTAGAVERAARDLGVALASVTAQAGVASGAVAEASALFEAPRHERTEPEMAPLFNGIELDATAILPETGTLKEDGLEAFLEDEIG